MAWMDNKDLYGLSSLDSFGESFTDALNYVGDTFFGGSHHTNEVNERIAQQNIEFQKWANEQNIAFTKAENDITRAREDTAVQRAAADMTAAGLSKTLAAGSPASAQALNPPQVSAPNNGFQMQKNMAGLNMIDAIQNIAFKAKEANRAEKLNDAQIANINADTRGKTISNQTLADRLANENALNLAKTEQTKSLTDLYRTQNYVEGLLGPKNAAKIDSEIDLNLSKYEESLASAKYTGELTKKAVEDTKKSVQETEYYKNLSDEVKKKVDYLVEQIAYEKIKIKSMTWDLDVAKTWGYPTGQYPSSLFGVIERMGKGAEIANESKAEFAKNQYTKTMHGIKNAFEDLDDMYGKEADGLQGFGAGLLDALRAIFNFSPLNWLMK